MVLIRLLRKSLKLALISTLAACPYLYYLFFESGADYLLGALAGPLGLSFAEQLGRVFLLIFLTGLVGFSWGRAGILRGFGEPSRLAEAVPYLILTGLVLGALTFTLGDAYFIRRVPFYYPDRIWFALAVPLYAVFVEELFTRFGLMTLLIRFFRNVHLANILTAFLFAASHVTLLAAPGVPYRFWNYITLSSLFLNVGSSLFLGYAYVHWGLGAPLLIQFFAHLRFLAATVVR